MRRFLIAFCFSLIFCSCTQNIGDLYNINQSKLISWGGLTDKFIIEDNSDFQLNDEAKEGTAYLYAISGRLRETVWRFTADFRFNPSSKSFVRYYLSASSYDFIDNAEGYFIQLGSTTDEVSLYRQDGEECHKLITGRKKLLDHSSFSVSVKVTCDADGKWTLYSYLSGADYDWHEEGIALDDTYAVSSYMGFYMEYSPSYSSKLSVNNVSIKNISDDEDDDFDDSSQDTPSVSASFGDVVFSEIMANPVKAYALPEVEYIELYNRTEKPVSLSGWKFFYGTKSYSLSTASIAPHGFMVLYNEKYSSLLSAWKVPLLPMKSFPVLANTGKLLYLEDAASRLVSWVEYSDKWYQDDFKKKGGFSLECADTDNLSGLMDNWKGSTDKRGGTPGEGNSVKSLNLDNTLPYVSGYYLSAPDTFVINFSKPMQTASLLAMDNYYQMGESGVIDKLMVDYPRGRSVRFVLQTPLGSGELLEYQLDGLKDISGFDLTGELTVRAKLSEEVALGDILFNEILFNPRSGGVDYVELYNNTDKYIALSNLYLSSRKDDGSFSDGMVLSKTSQSFPPHSYLCFTSDVNAVSNQYACAKTNMCELSKLPGMPDDKGTIALLSASGEVLDEVCYSAKMHSALLKDVEGYSLEKRYPALSSSVSSNWLTASTQSGGGTPGYQNSQYREPGMAVTEGFALENKSFSPDNDGNNDELLISYVSPGEGFVADMRVYDSVGRPVCTIADGVVLASKGTFVWTGKDDSGRQCRMGMYVIYIETYNSHGKVMHYKLSCTLSR